MRAQSHNFGATLRGIAFLGVALIVNLAGCSSSSSPTGGSTSGLLPQNPVGFRMVLGQGSTSSLAPQALSAGANVAITYAVIQVKRVSFLLPPGFTCVKYSTEVSKEAEEREKEEMEHMHSDHMGSGMTMMHSEENTGASGEATKPARIPFRHSDECESDPEGPARIHFKGPFRVDLVAGTSQPPLEKLAVPAGTYKRVDVRIDDLEGAPTDPLNGYSLLAYGTYSDATTTIAFRIALEFNEDIRFESPQGVTIGTEGGKDFLVQFPVSTWLGNLDLSSCFKALPPNTTFVDFDERNESEPADSCKIEKLLKESFKKSGRFKRED